MWAATSASEGKERAQTGQSKELTEDWVEPLTSWRPEEMRGSKGLNSVEGLGSEGLGTDWREDLWRDRDGGGWRGWRRREAAAEAAEAAEEDGEDAVAEAEEEDEEEPRTRPWPLNLEEGEEEKGLLTFLMRPFILSLTSSIAEK